MHVQRKYDVMHVPYHSTHAQYDHKGLVFTQFLYSIIPISRDEILALFPGSTQTFVNGKHLSVLQATECWVGPGNETMLGGAWE